MEDLIVILINWQNERQTLKCIRTLRSWKTTKPTLLVIDNQSTKLSREKLSHELTADELICNPVNLGYAGGNNLGIKQALLKKKDFILLLNTDAEISEAGVMKLLKRLKANPDISILGPVILEGQNDHLNCLIGGRDIAKYSFTRIVGEPAKLNAGTVFLVRSSLFEEIGFLDEQYFFSGEIADFCKRARTKGHKICTDLEVEAHHFTNKTASNLRESLYVYYSLRNRFLYIKKHYKALEKLKLNYYWIKTGMLQYSSALIKRNSTKPSIISMALKHALSNKFGNQNDKFL